MSFNYRIRDSIFRMVPTTSSISTSFSVSHSLSQKRSAPPEKSRSLFIREQDYFPCSLSCYSVIVLRIFHFLSVCDHLIVSWRSGVRPVTRLRIRSNSPRTASPRLAPLPTNLAACCCLDLHYEQFSNFQTSFIRLSCIHQCNTKYISDRKIYPYPFLISNIHPIFHN